jgi:hypothetical protein
LGQGYVAAGRDASEDVFDPIDLLLPQGFTEPDAELFDDQTTPAGGEEMPEFVNDDHQVKNDQNPENDQDGLYEFQEHRGK